MEYYLAIKKNKIMPFAATWMDLEILIVSEVSQRKTNRNLKEGTNELKYNLQTRRKISANDATDKGLISKIYKQLIQLGIKNKQTTQGKKNGQGTSLVAQ